MKVDFFFSQQHDQGYFLWEVFLHTLKWRFLIAYHLWFFTFKERSSFNQVTLSPIQRNQKFPYRPVWQLDWMNTIVLLLRGYASKGSLSPTKERPKKSPSYQAAMMYFTCTPPSKLTGRCKQVTPLLDVKKNIMSHNLKHKHMARDAYLYGISIFSPSLCCPLQML